MLALILPPFIVVLTLALLVFFFSRRYPEVEKSVQSDETGVLEKDGTSVFFRFTRFLHRGFLGVLERMARWSKVATLRAHNLLNRWTQSIREKKLKTTPVDQTGALQEKPVSRELSGESPLVLEEDVTDIRPMVSRRIVLPTLQASSKSTAQKMEKSQFEDILIERIAANPRDLEAYERLGEYYMEQGNAQDAKECYRQVLRLSPVHRLAKIKIRRLEKMLEGKRE